MNALKTAFRSGFKNLPISVNMDEKEEVQKPLDKEIVNAIKNGRLERIMKWVKEEKGPFNRETENLENIFHLAALSGKPKVFSTLLKHLIDLIEPERDILDFQIEGKIDTSVVENIVNAITKEDETPLIIAARVCNEKTVMEIVDAENRYDPIKIDAAYESAGKSALDWALHHGKQRMAVCLLDLDAPIHPHLIEIILKKGYSRVIEKCTIKKRRKEKRPFKTEEEEPDKEQREKWNTEAEIYNADVEKYMEKREVYNARVVERRKKLKEYRSSRGRTSLDLALSLDTPEGLKIAALLSNLEIPMKEINVYQAVARNCIPVLKAWKRNKENYKDWKSAFDMVREGSYTVLHWAVQCKHPAVVRYIVSTGVDPNIKDDSGLLPLDWAVIYRHPGMVCQLLKCEGREPITPETLARAIQEDMHDVAEAYISDHAHDDGEDFGQFIDHVVKMACEEKAIGVLKHLVTSQRTRKLKWDNQLSISKDQTVSGRCRFIANSIKLWPNERIDSITTQVCWKKRKPPKQKDQQNKEKDQQKAETEQKGILFVQLSRTKRYEGSRGSEASRSIGSKRGIFSSRRSSVPEVATSQRKEETKMIGEHDLFFNIAPDEILATVKTRISKKNSHFMKHILNKQTAGDELSVWIIGDEERRPEIHSLTLTLTTEVDQINERQKKCRNMVFAHGLLDIIPHMLYPKKFSSAQNLGQRFVADVSETNKDISFLKTILVETEDFVSKGKVLPFSQCLGMQVSAKAVEDEDNPRIVYISYPWDYSNEQSFSNPDPQGYVFETVKRFLLVQERIHDPVKYLWLHPCCTKYDDISQKDPSKINMVTALFIASDFLIIPSFKPDDLTKRPFEFTDLAGYSSNAWSNAEATLAALTGKQMFIAYEGLLNQEKFFTQIAQVHVGVPLFYRTSEEVVCDVMNDRQEHYRRIWCQKNMYRELDETAAAVTKMLWWYGEEHLQKAIDMGYHALEVDMEVSWLGTLISGPNPLSELFKEMGPSPAFMPPKIDLLNQMLCGYAWILNQFEDGMKKENFTNSHFHYKQQSISPARSREASASTDRKHSISRLRQKSKSGACSPATSPRQRFRSNTVNARSRSTTLHSRSRSNTTGSFSPKDIPPSPAQRQLASKEKKDKLIEKGLWLSDSTQSPLKTFSFEDVKISQEIEVQDSPKESTALRDKLGKVVCCQIASA